ncbi:MAG TPA: pyridoxamine 5'-phosphate oxidase family protein [Acidimicrobiia bacterium]|nr:pyridoxamine 5'-phosphate oxidase family protein [Acidimicrobiia bacterium]
MTREPKTDRNLDGYDAPIIAWSKVRDVLAGGITQITQGPGTGGPDRHTSWLATVRPDGRPHVMPLGVLWTEDRAFFTAGPASQKARNLARDPRCTLTVATEPFDLVVEGEAVRVTDDAALQRVAAGYAEMGWAPTARDGALYHDYSAPSAGPPPWHAYELTPTTVYAFGTVQETAGATRWRF